MISFFRRRSRFARTLEAYGLGRCSATPGQLWIGLPPSAEHRRAPVAAVPDAVQSVLFVEAPEQAELVAALAASPEAETVEHVMIGTTHDYIRPGRLLPYDMSAAVAALAEARLPALRRLSLGAMELLFNGHGYYGIVGDLTPLFDAAPNLQRLDVSGSFELRRPVRHERLESLIVDVDEIGISGGPLGQDTITHILSSSFPALRECQLALDADDVQPYDVPDVFFTGSGFPKLEAFAMDWLKPEAEARLKAYKAARSLRW